MHNYIFHANVNKLISKVLFHSKDVGHWYSVIVQLMFTQCVSNNCYCSSKFFVEIKIVRIIYFPIIFSDKINIELNIYILWNRAFWKHACESWRARHMRGNVPHYVDTLFSGMVEKMKTELDRLLLVLTMKRSFPINFAKIEFKKKC